ncbi:hypothetical protein Tco_0592520 [Tanacetum coccineum]
MNSDHPDSPAPAAMPVERGPVEREPVEREPVEREPVEQEPVELGGNIGLIWLMICAVIFISPMFPLHSAPATQAPSPQAPVSTGFPAPQALDPLVHTEQKVPVEREPVEREPVEREPVEREHRAYEI